MTIHQAVLSLRSRRCFGCIVVLAFFAAGFSFSCSSSARRKAETSGNAPESGQAAVLEKKLLEATSQLLAVSENDNPQKYAQQRKRFDAALADYLRLAGPQRRIELRAVHDSLTLIFPIQFIDGGGRFLENAGAQPLLLPGETVNTGLKGEILDLAWLPKNKDAPAQIIALFADSLISLPWPNANGHSSPGAVYRFHQQESCFVRSALPAGVLALRDLDFDGSPEFIALTSSLKAAMILQQRQNQFSPIDSTKLPPDLVLPSSWKIEPGQELFQLQIPIQQNFRSLRPLANRRFVMLDELGYLKLFLEDTTNLIWKSERPWGNRLFLMPPDIIAVCDNRQSAFAVFRLNEPGLQLLGQSAQFNGTVSALLSIELKNKNGSLISTVFADANGLPVSRLQFIPQDSLRWKLPIRLHEPRFPDYGTRLTVLQETRENFLPDWHARYPPMFWPNVFETLYRKDENGVSLPVLAVNLRADSTAKIWEIGLRQDICFADGSPLTADAVRRSWQQNWLLCKKNNCGSQWLWVNLLGVNEFINGKNSVLEGLQVIDAHTLKIVLTEPRPRFIEHLTQPCFSVIKAEQGKSALGTGPFQIIGAQNDQSGSVWQWQRNIYYHGGLPLLQEIKLVFHRSNVAEVLMNLGPAGATVRRRKEVEYFRKIDKVRVHSFSAPAIYFLALNPSAKPLADPAQRRRVAAAVDREAVATLITQAECDVATNFFSPLEEELTPPETGQPASSRALVVFFRNHDEVAQQIAERLTVRFSRLQIPLARPRPLSNSAFEQIRRSGKYDILIDSYTPVFETPLYNLTQLLQRGYVVAPAINDALNQALTSAFPYDVTDLENALITQAILYPLVRAPNYAVVPVEMESVKLLEAQRIDFAKTWLPRRK